jgi:hypothetical protein
MMLPVRPGPAPRVTITVDVARPTRLEASLRVSRRPDEHTPSVRLAACSVDLQPGSGQQVALELPATFAEDRYAFWCLDANPDVAVHESDLRISGVLSVFHRQNKAVAKSAVQTPPEGSGMDSFEFWTPERRPEGRNLALTIEPALDGFGPDQLTTGVNRPTSRPNCWVADPADPAPRLTVEWPASREIGRVEMVFDTDLDHPMESVLMGHPERSGPFCVRTVVLRDDAGRELARIEGNHATLRAIVLDPPARLTKLVLDVAQPGAGAPAAVVGLRCYSPDGRGA